MKCEDILNLIALIIIPIIAVVIGHHLQNRSKRRDDKMEIFKTLMISRTVGWTNESVRALNIIEVVFSDNKSVLKQWKIYYDKLCVENPTETDIKKIQNERYKLIETIAKALGYKNKITWETIQNPYIPKGMTDLMEQQQKYQNYQLELMKNMVEGIDYGKNNKESESKINELE